MEFKKYLTIVGYEEYQEDEDPLMVFGADIYSKTKKEARKVSKFLNFPNPTFEVCEVLYTTAEDIEDCTEFSSN